MAAALLPLPTWTRGDTIGPIVITYTGPTLAGATVTMTFKTRNPAATTQTLVSPTHITVSGTTTGTITVAAFKPATAGELYWDMEVDYADGTTITLFRDCWTVLQDESA